jgi:hypothetical protein
MTPLPGPSPHLSWDELSCLNRSAKPWNGVPAWGLIAPYPLDWRLSRAPLISSAFELVRALRGLSLSPQSSYRTPEYNAAVGGEPHSLHLQGLALDLPIPAGCDPAAWHRDIVALAQTPAGRMIRGIGFAPPSYQGGFVHVDCRQSVSLVQWTYPL